MLKELQKLQSRREELEKRQHQTELCAQVDHEGCALADLQEHLWAFNIATISEGPQVQHAQQQQQLPITTGTTQITAVTLQESASENSLLPPTPLDVLLADLHFFL